MSSALNVPSWVVPLRGMIPLGNIGGTGHECGLVVKDRGWEMRPSGWPISTCSLMKGAGKVCAGRVGLGTCMLVYKIVYGEREVHVSGTLPLDRSASVLSTGIDLPGPVSVVDHGFSLALLTPLQR